MKIYNSSSISLALHHFHIEIVKDYVYLGIICSSTGSYLNTKKKIVEKATKALHEALKKGRVHNLSIQCQYDLFD
jgi:hypothetical protein